MKKITQNFSDYLAITVTFFIITGVRLLAVEDGKVIAANVWGKVKTVTQMIALILVLSLPGIEYVAIATYLAALISLVSGVDYFWKNKKVLLEDVFE